MNELTLSVEVQPDCDGFIPMECPLCEERFGLRAHDIEDDEVLDIRCPHCGIASESYATSEVIELAKAKLTNAALGLLHDEMKKLEKQTKGKLVEIKAGKRPREEPEPVLVSGVDNLMRVHCDSCGREAKVSPALAQTVFVCPCCGVSNIHG